MEVVLGFLGIEVKIKVVEETPADIFGIYCYYTCQVNYGDTDHFLRIPKISLDFCLRIDVFHCASDLRALQLRH